MQEAVNGNSEVSMNGSLKAEIKDKAEHKENGFSNGNHEEEEHDEMQYINLIKTILKKGISRGDRTGTIE
jgi:hypothetical protein